jgi:4-hydroxy-tetrahydrodipicolinate reductase
MGREVDAVLRQRSHEAVPVRRGDPYPPDCPVGIDFTIGEAVLDNVSAALEARARYVVGTTGWAERLEEVASLVRQKGGGLVFAANFSIGVNLFYRVVRQAASLFARFPDYDPFVLERHHRGKQDAPSGTARTLAALLEESHGPRARGISSFVGAIPDDAFHVAAVRAGGVIGEHTVGFDSGGDEVLIEHRARSRRGFAYGSVLAAEWIVSRSGVFGFEEVLEDLISCRG